MIKGWALRNLNHRVGPLAVSMVPLLAVLAVVLANGELVAFDASSVTRGVVLLLVYLACFQGLGLGEAFLKPSQVEFLARTGLAVAAGVALAWGIVLAFPEVPVGIASASAVGFACALMLVGLRSILLVEPTPGITDNILVLGREDLAEQLCSALEGSSPIQIGLSPDRGASAELDADGLKRLVRAEGITRIVVVGSEIESNHQLSDALLECRLLGVPVEDGIELYQRLHGKLWLEAVQPGRLAFSDGFRLTPAYRVLKRAMDLLAAVVLLIVAAPVMALIALAVKLDSPGPVLFRQVRVGQFGRPFTLFKFRSMRQDAEKNGPAWASKNDDRSTRVGRFLRKSHLDELPQVWNVLRGELSFVGPRPERPCFVEMLREEIDYFDLRHYVKPGITGWAQVRYPYCDSVEDSYEKVQYDLYYARHASLPLDLRILVLTAIHMLAGRGR